MFGSWQLLVRQHVAHSAHASTPRAVRQNGNSTGDDATGSGEGIAEAVKQNGNSTCDESGEDDLDNALRVMAIAVDSLLLPGEEVVMCEVQHSEADWAVGVPAEADVKQNGNSTVKVM